MVDPQLGKAELALSIATSGAAGLSAKNLKTSVRFGLVTAEEAANIRRDLAKKRREEKEHRHKQRP